MRIFVNVFPAGTISATLSFFGISRDFRRSTTSVTNLTNVENGLDLNLSFRNVVQRINMNITHGNFSLILLWLDVTRMRSSSVVIRCLQARDRNWSSDDAFSPESKVYKVCMGIQLLKMYFWIMSIISATALIPRYREKFLGLFAIRSTTECTRQTQSLSISSIACALFHFHLILIFSVCSLGRILLSFVFILIIIILGCDWSSVAQMNGLFHIFSN